MKNYFLLAQTFLRSLREENLRVGFGWVILLLLILPGSSTCAMTQHATTRRRWLGEDDHATVSAFKRSLTIPFLDHLSAEIETQFSDTA